MNRRLRLVQSNIETYTCDDYTNCKPSYWRSNDRKNLSKLVVGVAGGLFYAAIGHQMDSGSRGLDPSDWVKIDWPGEVTERP